MSNPNHESDFAQVRLSTAGLAFAGQSETLRMGNAHSDYIFVGQIPQKVVRRGELPMFLAYTLADGSPAFELVPESPVTAVSAAAASITTATTEVQPHAE